MVSGKHQGGVRWHFCRQGTPPLSTDLRCRRGLTPRPPRSLLCGTIAIDGGREWW
ncbi:hypothetical protein HanPI659440_Chr03g0109301 [Helianthus annuus]|nr:hypothetical protein HanPI659440_Chr03g0109301 [Helianthus annuus]